jgi:glycerol-3-phosphate dehydrogenase
MSALWRREGRAALPGLMEKEWDLLVIGGGITGAGILLEAARRGLRALLVEQRDFAWGTSSRSSKLVHGGLRYLKDGHLHLTRESVRERESLLRDAPGLVEPQGFAFAHYAGQRGRRSFLAGLAIYDMLAGRRERHWLAGEDFLARAPNVAPRMANAGLEGGIVYTDAKTDDARLVLRALGEAMDHGGAALNYVAARSLRRDGGRVTGAVLHDQVGGGAHTVRARVTVDATGAWSGALHGKGPRLRPLRGSHLILPAWRLPLSQAVSLMHPRDGRPVFAYPWEGTTLVGTTDLDHEQPMTMEARITRAELDYLLAALQAQFPGLDIVEQDVLSTFAGVRPVIAGGHADASREGREHSIWSEDGLVAVAGGKLTTFRAIALDALKHVRAQLPGWRDELQPCRVFAPAPERSHAGLPAPLSASLRRRLQGRHGAAAAALLAAAGEDELALIPGTETAWAELRWAARAEAVQRLEDLLLRRTRLGLQLRQGGAALMPRIRALCQPELGWDDARWTREEQDYAALWQSHYGLPRQQEEETRV